MELKKDYLLVAINSKYSHTNLAVRYLCHAIKSEGMEAHFEEYTINQPVREILESISQFEPKVLMFSVYLWNIEYTLRISREFNLMFPDVKIIFGGPEVSYNPQEILEKYPYVSAVVCGEGENQLPKILKNGNIDGIYKQDSFVDMNFLSFPYDDLSKLENRVLYYESTRGCPFGCAYCLSSSDRNVRYRDLSLVFEDLQKFLDANVMKVKFVDRTFNLNTQRAYEIWKYLIEHDNNITSFQMEIGGDLTTPQQLSLLSKARTGLFQFEIGVQSTNEETLNRVARKTDISKLKKNVAAIKSFKNIHQHLDLIAGLPFESYERFKQSFNDVFYMQPEQLQLGFLKMLKGSSLYSLKDELNLTCSPFSPYEILKTPNISFMELAKLKKVENMCETYYNSGRFTNQLSYILKILPNPFELFLGVGETMPQRPLSKYEYYDFLFQYAVSNNVDSNKLSWLMRLDLCLHERLRKLPLNAAAGASAQEKKKLLPQKAESHIFYDLFPNYVLYNDDSLKGMSQVMFDYSQRDPWGHAEMTITKDLCTD